MYSTKRIFLALMLTLMSSSAMLFAQSTEGKDFKPYIGVFGYSADKRMKNLKWKNKWTKKH